MAGAVVEPAAAPLVPLLHADPAKSVTVTIVRARAARRVARRTGAGGRGVTAPAWQKPATPRRTTGTAARARPAARAFHGLGHGFTFDLMGHLVPEALLLPLGALPIVMMAFGLIDAEARTGAARKG
jgi:hypothetical protein